MKRIICAFICTILLLNLAACGGNTPQTVQPTQSAQTEPVQTEPVQTEPAETLPPMPVPDADAFHFTRENFPRLDGSTSLVPLGQGIASVLLGETREDAADLVSFNRTTQSFRNLQAGECDIVIAAEPQNVVFEEMDASGFRYEIETIAREALVFVVNEGNGVDSLTAQQLRDIYSGKITNWKDVGGADLPIEAFQRNPGAGSQVMMEKLVMDDMPMMKAPESHVPGAMGELINAVKNYDNSANAIGYTVFYYASDMQMAKGLKILKVDGVLPKAETIRSGEYPYVNGYYCCIPASTPEQSPSRRLYNWLVSGAGQTLLGLEGYVSVYESGNAPSAGTDVFTDYTHYTPNGGTPARFTELPGGTPDHLIPSDSYGMLYPYTGSLLYSAYEDSYDYQSAELCGFFNEDGVLITKPVYDSIYSVSFGDDGSFLWIFSRGGKNQRVSFATSDGSYVSPQDYASVRTVGPYLLCVKDYDTYGFELYDKNWKLCKTEADFTFDGKVAMPNEYADGIFICDNYDENYNSFYYAVKDSGELIYGPEPYIHPENGLIVAYIGNDSSQAHNPDGSLFAINGETTFRYFYSFTKDLFHVTMLDGTELLVRKDGTVMHSGFQYAGTASDDVFYTTIDNMSTYYDQNGNVLCGGPLPSVWHYSSMGSLFYRWDDVQCSVKDFSTGKEIVLPGKGYIYPMMDGINPVQYLCYSAYSSANDTAVYLIDKDMHMTILDCANVNLVTDSVTGEGYLVIADAYGFSNETRFYSMDAKTELFRASGRTEIRNGLFITVNDRACSVHRRDGTQLLCYPFYGLGSGD